MQRRDNEPSVGLGNVANVPSDEPRIVPQVTTFVITRVGKDKRNLLRLLLLRLLLLPCQQSLILHFSSEFYQILLEILQYLKGRTSTANISNNN